MIMIRLKFKLFLLLFMLEWLQKKTKNLLS